MNTTNDYLIRHMEAMAVPKPGFERAVAVMVKGWLEYAETVQDRYSSTIGQDGVLGDEWQAIGEGLLGLLNGELGRLDAGTLDAIIRDNMKVNDCQPKE